MLNKEEVLNPKEYGIKGRAIIKKLDKNITIEKIRKTRIIMKDASQILDQVETLQKHFPEHNFILKIGGPICSKSIKLLNEHNIEIVE